MIYTVFSGKPIGWVWLLPIALGLQFMLQTGLCWILATVHVFFRDVVQILGFVLTIWFYLSPILYSVRGGKLEAFFLWNPMTPLLGLFRSAIFPAPLPSAIPIVFLLTVVAVLFFGGLWFFRRAQPGFADLI